MMPHAVKWPLAIGTLAMLAACSHDAACIFAPPTLADAEYSLHVGESFYPALTLGNSCGLPVAWIAPNFVSLDTMIVTVDSTHRVHARAVGVGRLSAGEGHIEKVKVLP